MNALSQEVAENTTTKNTKAERLETSKKIIAFQTAINAQHMTQQQAAALVGIPRSTLYHNLKRQEKIPLSNKTIEFFESPDGVEFLHCLLTGILLVMVQMGGCGLRLASLLLRHCHVDHFVASSYGSLQKQTVALEKIISEFGCEETERLSKGMSAKKISACVDETFHPSPCLVAIEPVSNFILVEEYSEKRDGASWESVMRKGVANLPIEIIQITGDEGSGLVNFAQKRLGVNHSSDIFHVQQDFTKATSAPLNSQLKQAENAYNASLLHYEEINTKKELYEKKDWPNLDAMKKQEEAELELNKAKEKLTERENRNKTVKAAKKALGEIYHPYDLETGEMQTEAMLSEKIEAQFTLIKQSAIDASLSGNSLKRIEKAHRVFPKLVSTLAFFWLSITAWITELKFTADQETIMREILIPAFYLHTVSKKATRSERKRQIKHNAEKLFSKLEKNKIWLALDDIERQKMLSVAEECSQLFQRSSSCVEGRNGYLSLRHHGLHKLSTRKLEVLKVLHNFWIKRTDHTTAAERFFGNKPKDLFAVLLQRLPYPPRPAEKRLRLVA
jgi:hypothetical protein